MADVGGSSERIAIPDWQERVSPLLDTAAAMVVYDSRDKSATLWDRVRLIPGRPATLARQLADMEIEVVICGAVTRALAAAMQAATQKSEEAANVVIGMKGQINRLAERAALHQARRLVAEEPNRLQAYTVEMDILQNLKRIYYFAKRMARLVVPSEDLRETSSLREVI